jgi:hypothetical protein
MCHITVILDFRRIEAAWFAFRAEALRQIALDWCEDNHIPWE